MYTNIINNNKVSFKDIEQEIFRRCCEAARNATTEILKSMDESIAKIRDKSVYRDKGCRKTSIKTVYGEVEYSRHVYICKDENGDNRSVYLLDQELGIDTIGLVSSNLAEKLINAATKVSFRQAAEMVTETTGQSISHGGVWNLVQTIGEKLEKEEEMLVEEFHSDSSKGLKNYKSVIKDLPEAPDGIVYKNMGVQENQNCTLITLRMKGKRKRWAAKSANHMVKPLYYKENADLKEAVERYTDIDLWSETVREKLPEPLSAGRTPKVDGKGKNKYYEIMNAHLPITGSSNSQSVKLFKRIIY